MFGTKTIPKFKQAQKNVNAAIMSAVSRKPYTSVSLPPRIGAIAEPTAKAMF